MNGYEFSTSAKRDFSSSIIQFSKEESMENSCSQIRSQKIDSNAGSKMNFVSIARKEKNLSNHRSTARISYQNFISNQTKANGSKIRKYSPRRARTNLFTFTQLQKNPGVRFTNGEENCITLMPNNFSTCLDPRNEIARLQKLISASY